MRQGPKFSQQTSNRLAAPIHIRLRLNENNFFAVKDPLPDERIAAFSCNQYIILLGNTVYDTKSNIVPGVLILFPGIAESNHKLHGLIFARARDTGDQDSSPSSLGASSGAATASPSTAAAGTSGAASTVGGTTVTKAKLDSYTAVTLPGIAKSST